MAPRMDLVVEFIGETYLLSAGQSLRFGRSAELVIDDENVNLHRELGEFIHVSGQWWLRNIGRSIPLRLWTSDGSSRSVVMSGTDVALSAPTTNISFEAGQSRYELTVERETNRPTVKTGESDTVAATDLPLTLTQRQLILSLAEPALRNPGSAIFVPASKDAAKRLGWPMTKFNAKLQNVCDKFARIGVRGLGANTAGTTMDRRLRLVEYCIFNKVVTDDDLPILELPQRGGPG